MERFETEEDYHRWTCWVLFLLAPVVFSALHFGGQKAAYGRYSMGSGEGEANLVARLLATPVIPGRLDWFLHAASLLSVALVWRRAETDDVPACNLVLLGCFLLHYVWRSFVFAILVKNPKPMTLPLGLSTSGFCLMNGWLQAAGLLLFRNQGSRGEIPPDDVYAPRFLLGLAMFFFGWYTNVSSDLALINLRKSPEDRNYYIPKGGLFELVSGANFLGEIIEWAGFAYASGYGRGPLAFAVFTFANLAPRAMQHHQWYKDKFKDEYPKQRRGLIPYLW
jgi:3-oxo-5-alpha-steroid 4-dehydrogenase 1